MSAIKKNSDGRTATLKPTGTGTPRDTGRPAATKPGRAQSYKKGREPFGKVLPGHEDEVYRAELSETFDNGGLIGVDPCYHPPTPAEDPGDPEDPQGPSEG